MILSVDPGTEESAFAVLNVDGSPIVTGIFSNPAIERLIRERTDKHIVCEWIESYGMAVGQEVFHACRWIGRFQGAAGEDRFTLLTRREVKLHLCKTMKATDANIRAALIDRFGPGKDKAVGLKKTPGPLYGIKSHCWSALAVGVTYFDQQLGEGVRIVTQKEWAEQPEPDRRITKRRINYDKEPI